VPLLVDDKEGELEVNIYQKMVEVRKRVPFIGKDAENRFHRFGYVSSSAVLNALRPLLDEYGIVLVPEVRLAETAEHITGKDKRHILTHLHMIYTFVNAENPDEKIECRFYGQGLDDGEKGVGKAATYAEKYFLLKFFNIPTDCDDPDAGEYSANASSKPPSKSPSKSPSKPTAAENASQGLATPEQRAEIASQGLATPKQRAEIRKLASNKRLDEKTAALAIGVSTDETTSAAKAAKTIKRLEEILAEELAP